ncbi:MAG: CerR family C-terminal domain-containing protein [Phascolarctobacterium sp.]|nr:CerR family C-terminal domain-containing protein [Phascolarctobacterium sp.]
MTQPVEQTSAEKILAAATELFARNNFDAVSVKQIAEASNCNGALISYYFGGKKNLYQEVLYTQAKEFINIQEAIRVKKLSPFTKLHAFVDSIAKLQAEHPYHIHLIYREMLSPEPMFEKYIHSHLYRVHTFMAELVEEAIANGEIKTNIRPTHVAFTLESIILFFFLAKQPIMMLGNFDTGKETDYLLEALDTYIMSLR